MNKPKKAAEQRGQRQQLHASMRRWPRIQLDGVPLHIVQRGHNREPCLFSDEESPGWKNK